MEVVVVREVDRAVALPAREVDGARERLGRVPLRLLEPGVVEPERRRHARGDDRVGARPRPLLAPGDRRDAVRALLADQLRAEVARVHPAAQREDRLVRVAPAARHGGLEQPGDVVDHPVVGERRVRRVERHREVVAWSSPGRPANASACPAPRCRISRHGVVVGRYRPPSRNEPIAPQSSVRVPGIRGGEVARGASGTRARRRRATSTPRAPRRRPSRGGPSRRRGRRGSTSRRAAPRTRRRGGRRGARASRARWASRPLPVVSAPSTTRTSPSTWKKRADPGTSHEADERAIEPTRQPVTPARRGGGPFPAAATADAASRANVASASGESPTTPNSSCIGRSGRLGGAPPVRRRRAPPARAPSAPRGPGRVRPGRSRRARGPRTARGRRAPRRGRSGSTPDQAITATTTAGMTDAARASPSTRAIGRRSNARSSRASRQAKNATTIVEATDDDRAMPATPIQRPKSTSRVTLKMTLMMPPASSTRSGAAGVVGAGEDGRRHQDHDERREGRDDVRRPLHVLRAERPAAVGDGHRDRRDRRRERRDRDEHRDREAQRPRGRRRQAAVLVARRAHERRVDRRAPRRADRADRRADQDLGVAQRADAAGREQRRDRAVEDHVDLEDRRAQRERRGMAQERPEVEAATSAA